MLVPNAREIRIVVRGRQASDQCMQVLVIGGAFTDKDVCSTEVEFRIYLLQPCGLADDTS